MPLECPPDKSVHYLGPWVMLDSLYEQSDLWSRPWAICGISLTSGGARD